MDGLALRLSSSGHKHHVVLLTPEACQRIYLKINKKWVKDLRLGGHPVRSLLGPTPHPPCQAADKQQ